MEGKGAHHGLSKFRKWIDGFDPLLDQVIALETLSLSYPVSTSSVSLHQQTLCGFVNGTVLWDISDTRCKHAYTGVIRGVILSHAVEERDGSSTVYPETVQVSFVLSSRVASVVCFAREVLLRFLSAFCFRVFEWI